MSGDPQKIGGFILDTLNKMGFSSRLKKQEAVTKWSEIVGKLIAAEAEALRIDGDTLVVKVPKAAWRQQLIFLKEEILTKINEQIEGDIEDIRFI